MYDRILVATDGSETARVAVDHAIDLAAVHDAALHALYVLHLRPSLEPNLELLYDQLEALGEEATAQVAENAAQQGVEVVEAMANGTPHRQILDYVDEHDVDLVVLGTHGRTGLEHALVGSVAERVVRLSPVPVLTVRHPASDE
ncbi:universal stress protein [Halomarina salina]|uniref:Universal stress protein n=1 Tax=Halomarina salina TaxID=1872699 RepID=A0ABD5RLG6_9EURY|nr:universal stress protein [Halomarina salina]